jgi:glycosyltransferase involved in cell wall biosynthesis
VAQHLVTATHKRASRYLPTELQWIREAFAHRGTHGASVPLRTRLSKLLSLPISWGADLYRHSRAAVFNVVSPDLYRAMYAKARASLGDNEAPAEEKMPLLVRLGIVAGFLLFRLIRLPVRLLRWLLRLAVRISRFVPRAAVRLGRTSYRSLRRIARTYAIARDEVYMIQNGALAELSSSPRGTEIVPGRIMYLVYNSLPYHSAGYATRSQGLVTGIRNLGFDSTIVSRLGYPHVFSSFRTIAPASAEEIEGVPYIRLNTDLAQIFSTSTREYIKRNTAAAIEVAERLRPAIVHGASNFVTGLTAVGVARALGVPSVYEVRGLWEITALSRDPSYIHTLRYAQALRLETEACLGADRVIAITEALKDELVRRGVDAEKIDVVPNGVDTERFQPRPRDNLLGTKLGLGPDHIVIGYVGSILDYEGLDDLLRAVRLCIDRGLTNLRVLIVGDGAAYSSCLELARELDLEKYTIFTGRVPYGEVEAYYSLVDVTPFPRKPLPVTEMVSPLKPFEAMAMGKCVIVSSVAALAEIIGDRPIGFVHEKGSVEALAEVIARVATDRDLRLRIGDEARRFVVAERDWRILARRVTEVYEKLSSTASR